MSTVGLIVGVRPYADHKYYLPFVYWNQLCAVVGYVALS